MTDNAKPGQDRPPKPTPAKAGAARETRQAADPGKPAKAAGKSATGTKKARPPARKPRTKRRHPGTLALYLAQLALLSALAVAGGMFYLWQANESQLARLQQQLGRLDTGMDRNVEQQQQFEQAVRHELGLLNERQQALFDSIDDLIRTRRYLKQDWLVAEANYLVNLAGEQLTLARDVDTALAALRAADTRLREVGDPSLLPVRKALAHDILALEAVNRPDLAGLSLKLSALAGEVDTLPLLTPGPASAVPEPPQGDATAPRVEDWKALPAAMWDDLKKLIIIRDHQGPIKPLLSPGQHFFLIQNLKLQLEQARLALLRNEDGVYHERLATAESWIRNWFDIGDDHTRHALEVIAELGAQDIQPALPDITASYRALKAYREEQARPPAQPEPPASQSKPAADATTLQVPL